MQPNREYRYDGLLRFRINPFIVEPIECIPEYECLNISGPDGFTDICEAGDFNRMTGWYSFETTDEGLFPPGVYEI